MGEIDILFQPKTRNIKRNHYKHNNKQQNAQKNVRFKTEQQNWT